MVSLPSLWLPILLSALFAWLTSAVIHMLLRWHNNDFDKLPGEEAIRNAMREQGVGQGAYVFPRADDPKDQMGPEMQEDWARGPSGVLTVYPPGKFNMGPVLAKWFLYQLVVSFFAAYIASRALGPGAEYLDVHQMAGAAAFLAYGGSLAQRSIWWGLPWRITLIDLVDSLIYALVVGGTFGWLWP